MTFRQLLLIKAYSTLDELERSLLISDLAELDKLRRTSDG